MEAALAVDLGGTDLRVGVVGADGAVMAVRVEPTAAQAGPDAVIDRIEHLSREVADEAAGVRIVGAGLGAPGPLDPEAGLMLDPSTLPGWRDYPIVERLEERLAMPVRLENDANAAALGEWRFGAGRGLRSLVFVTVSTGIGGGVIADGRILHGRRGLGAEIGHMTIADPDRTPGWFGTPGIWESLASGSALGNRATRETAAGDGSALRRLSGEGPVSARHVVEAARAGDAPALRLLADEARWLGLGFVNLLHLYSPEAIVVGGGLANGLDLMRDGIAEVILSRAMPPYRDVPVVPAALGRHAGLVGAASLVFEGLGAGTTEAAPHQPA